MIIVRFRYALDDRTFMVLAEPWYDAIAREWKGRLLFVPLDRSERATLSTGALRMAVSRDAILAWLRKVSDRRLARALRAVTAATRSPRMA